MSPKFKTRDVPKAQYSNYLKRAEECLSSARTASAREEWNSSAINSIHAVISSADAMCVYFLGKRHSGENHNEAARLFKSVKDDDDTSTNANRISRVLGMKNMAE
jgi:HEPN domain-containing protein